MTYEMNQSQFEVVIKYPAEKRYDHFIGKVGDQEEVWGLRNDEGFVSMADDTGLTGIPFWPHPDYENEMSGG